MSKTRITTQVSLGARDVTSWSSFSPLEVWESAAGGAVERGREGPRIIKPARPASGERVSTGHFVVTLSGDRIPASRLDQGNAPPVEGLLVGWSHEIERAIAEA